MLPRLNEESRLNKIGFKYKLQFIYIHIYSTVCANTLHFVHTNVSFVWTHDIFFFEQNKTHVKICLWCRMHLTSQLCTPTLHFVYFLSNIHKMYCPICRQHLTHLCLLYICVTFYELGATSPKPNIQMVVSSAANAETNHFVHQGVSCLWVVYIVLI